MSATIYNPGLLLILARQNRRKSQLERIQVLLKRKAAIEARMITSIKNIESATVWVEKALNSSLERRLGALGKLPSVLDSSLTR